MGLGADGVRVGTRFVTCPESGAHPEYVRLLLAANGADTVVTGWFNEGWEGAPHRVLRSALEAAQRTGWRSTAPPTRAIERGPNDMAMYAGMGVGDVTTAEPAAVVVVDLAGDLS
jgi:NAD(P)H-dependent flavin oxidoreductase YrpB (nitropropane dioxygenase family)